MREIKFRIYLPNLVHLGSLYLKESEAVENLINPFNGKLVFNIDEIEYNGDDITYYTDDGYILEQYTGFKDKTKKEIYEGDIIKHDLWGVFQCVWSEGAFRFINNNSDIALEHAQLKRCKIVGNIHENKHLLDETK